MGIEPTALAWEARVLPLYDARRDRDFTRNTPSTATLPGSTDASLRNHTPNMVKVTASRVTTISST
ncbi:MAG: hypothetical protein JWR14_5353 [Caballeronia sp.]|jgi:hypothetical protein|nr:hypothetical protein [Caballeronia sp.]